MFDSLTFRCDPAGSPLPLVLAKPDFLLWYFSPSLAMVSTFFFMTKSSLNTLSRELVERERPLCLNNYFSDRAYNINIFRALFVCNFLLLYAMDDDNLKFKKEVFKFIKCCIIFFLVFFFLLLVCMTVFVVLNNR